LCGVDKAPPPDDTTDLRRIAWLREHINAAYADLREWNEELRLLDGLKRIRERAKARREALVESERAAPAGGAATQAPTPPTPAPAPTPASAPGEPSMFGGEMLVTRLIARNRDVPNRIAAYAVLLDYGPMKPKQITDILLKAGMEIGGTPPEKTIRGTLWQQTKPGRDLVSDDGAHRFIDADARERARKEVEAAINNANEKHGG
jgi:hypothetical protein